MLDHSSPDALRVQQALVRWFAELTHQGFFATDCELRLIVWNRWMEVHSGRAAGDVLGRPLIELYPELRASGLDQCYHDALKGQIGVISHGLHRHVLRLPPTNRDLALADMPQSGRIGPLSDGDAVIGTVTTIEDVSDRLANDTALRRQIDVQQMARVAAEKALRAKDEFLSTVSHEMRNPLNAVLGWTRILLERQAVEPAVLARALRIIDRSATAQVRMIDDLLDVARIASGKLRLEMQAIDLPTVALAAVEVIGPSAVAGRLALRTNFDPKTPQVLGDQQRLQQIVVNLLSNAVKFTEPGGTVDVSVSPMGKRLARIEVRDTGSGISADFLPFVFERFRQSDASSARRHGGLGLGLALVRELVQLHGGTVHVRSAGERQGSTFTIDLPAAQASEITASALKRDAPAAMEPSALAGLRLLIVEDESDSRELLAATMTSRGAQVTTASSSDEALASIRHAAAANNLPHVILSDLGMPVSDGFDLIRRVRALAAEEGGRVPMVAVTGYADPVDGRRALAAGFDGHVSKPVDPSAIAAAVVRAAQRTSE